ncbi:hypothetical protein BDN71DRAFT_1436920 [Pleurotus eryngii]|uniref:mRNA 3'-end-processing protein RNA14 n=1 Tax=Pleurotus eryngii TaxID=5323 RepID=A0A9P6D934_PLEER|nr:hypothetical protein BDN71DRAFT_1436920 [Pleurotus eryngii]
MYMRFARRAEDIKSARAVFQRARKDRWVPWEVYDASVPIKPIKRTFREVDFVLKYLTSINDDNNARALFERVINNLPADRARPLWERWAHYEYQYYRSHSS